MFKSAATVAFLMITAPALAECPSGNAKEIGLVLTHANPYLSVTYEKAAEGLIEKKVTIAAQGPRIVVSVYSHPLLVVKRTVGNEVLSLLYLSDSRDLNRLAEYKKWMSDVELLANGQNEAHGAETLEFEGKSQLSIGDCRYEVWKINEILSLVGRKPVIDTKYYSPKLNIVLRSIFRTPDGRTMTDTSYDKITLLQK